MTIRADSAAAELVLTVDPSQHERLIAELTLLGFEAFLQEEEALRAYSSAEAWTSDVDNRVRALLAQLALSTEPRVTIIAPENWNQRWESSIQPVVVGRFVVTPSWHRNEVQDKSFITLEIDPKMSFGTGYHATTRLMLHLLPSVVREGDRVLDAGTGTGILAIAAAQLGASHVLGVDIDPWSERNARENCARNAVSDLVEIRQASISDVPEASFNTVLANIQFDVIVETLPLLRTKLLAGGRLLVSGILRSQAPSLTSSAGRSGFTLVAERTEAEWWAAALRLD